MVWSISIFCGIALNSSFHNEYKIDPNSIILLIGLTDLVMQSYNQTKRLWNILTSLYSPHGPESVEITYVTFPRNKMYQERKRQVPITIISTSLFAGKQFRIYVNCHSMELSLSNMSVSLVIWDKIQCILWITNQLRLENNYPVSPVGAYCPHSLKGIFGKASKRKNKLEAIYVNEFIKIPEEEVSLHKMLQKPVNSWDLTLYCLTSI